MGYVGFWKGVVLPRIGHLMCRPALMAFPFVLFWLLCSSKTKGQYGWVFVAFVPTLFAWLNDAYQLHLAVATRVPYTEAGGLAAFIPMFLQLGAGYLVYKVAHEGYGIVG